MVILKHHKSIAETAAEAEDTERNSEKMDSLVNENGNEKDLT